MVAVKAAEPVDEWLERVVAAQDPDKHNAGAPPGYALRGVSTLRRNENGNLQWIKTGRLQDDPAMFLDLFKAALKERPIARVTRTKSPRIDTKDLLAVYPMGDPHIGLLSWKPETGQNFDTTIAETRLVGAVDHLVEVAPACEQALIINLGDFFHADNSQGVTMRSGHVLDVDGRWARVLAVGLRIMHRCIDRALQKHKRVRVICEIGNHDDHSSIMMALALNERYRNEPRVEIDTSPAAFHWHEFGRVLIGTTHGNGPKLDKLGGIMAHDQAEAWGRTLHRYWYVGHFHHTRVMEQPGCTVEVFRTLASRDAWATASGYRSGQSMVCDVLHRDYGRDCRHEIGIGRLAA